MEERNDKETEKKSQVVDINPAEIEEVESQKKDLIDFEKHRLKPAKIESVEVVRIKSKYAKASDGMQHKLRVTGEVVESVESEKDDETITIEIRPSALIGMIEDKDGNLLGLPKTEDSDKSDWARMKKAIGNINNPKDLIGKELPMRINEAKTGTKFLGFMF